MQRQSLRLRKNKLKKSQKSKSETFWPVGACWHEFGSAVLHVIFIHIYTPARVLTLIYVEKQFVFLFCFVFFIFSRCDCWSISNKHEVPKARFSFYIIDLWPSSSSTITAAASSFSSFFFFRHNQTFFRSFHAPRLLFCFVFVNSLSRVTSRRHLYTRTAATESVDRNRCPFLGRGNKKQEKKKKVERTFLNFYRQCETEGPCHTLWKMNGVDLRDYVYIHYVSNVAKYTERQISW